MNCQTSQDLMMRLFDKEINDIELGHLRQHMKTCTHCAEEFEVYQMAFGCLENTVELEPPEDFEVQVMNRIQLSQQADAQKAERLLMYIYGSVTLVLAAAAVVCAMIFKNINIFDLMQGVDMVNAAGQQLSVFAEQFRSAFSLMASIVKSIAHTAYITSSNNYYYFALLAGILLIIKQAYAGYAGNTNAVAAKKQEGS